MKQEKFSATLSAGILASLVAMGMTATPASAAEEADQSSGMDHSQHDMGRDELGRTLYGMKHQMDPALTKELKQKVAMYKTYSDAQVALSMDMMGHEYAWYISPPDFRGEQGVLILLHGFGDIGDKVFKDEVQSIGNIFPTSLGIGMAMMMSSHIQAALDDLKKAGAKEVVVIPVVSTDKNELYRQWLYILGQQPKAEYASVPLVKTDAVLKFAKPPGDDPLVAEILIDYANEIGTDPKSELVVIAAHGPTNNVDNVEEMKTLASLAKMVKEDGGFADVKGMTLQDDAPPDIRAVNVQKLRAIVEGGIKDGKRVVIVTNLIGARTIQAKLRDDLKGLDYKFNAKGIVQHDNFMKWMGTAIRKELDRKASLQ